MLARYLVYGINRENQHIIEAVDWIETNSIK